MDIQNSLVCSICSEPFPAHHPCDQAHPGVCHGCAELNLRGGFDAREHLAPQAPLTLTPRDVQALVRYRLHKQAVLGTGPVGPHVVTEEDEA